MKYFTGDLTCLERHLIESQRVITVRGKHGTPVPIIIPADVQPALEKIANQTLREKFGLEDNQYLFANFSK